VQFSVFECPLDELKHQQLHAELEALINRDEGHVRSSRSDGKPAMHRWGSMRLADRTPLAW
jgi:CRISPR/Cas system-associated endoribonuclease Cas2